MITPDFYAEDFQSPKDVTKPQVSSWSIANPFDRLAAQILDISVVFIPLFSLAAAPLKRQMLESYFADDWKNISLLCTHFVFVFFMIYLAVNFLSQLFFKNTFGKKLLGLEVVNIWSGKPLGHWDHLMRSLVIFSQIFSLGLSFLLVLTNKKHRGVHDQLSDSIVLSVTGSTSHLLNTGALRSALRVATIAALALFIPFLLKIFDSTLGVLDLKSVFVSSTETEPICEKAEDLRQAMALVASGYMETKCLKDFVDMDFVDGAQPSALSYLAKSFLHVEDPELSDRYLEKVCKSDSHSAACVLAQFIASWSDGDISQIEDILKRGKEFNEPYLSLWALRYYQQSGHYRKSLEFAKGLINDEQIGIYARTQSLKAKYFLNDFKGADQDLVKMAQVSDSPVVLDTMAWACLKKISDSCEESSHLFCRAVSEADSNLTTYQTRVLLGKMRIEECSGRKPVAADYLSKGQPKAWKDFVYAHSKEKRGDFKSAWSLYSQIVKDESTPDYLKAEAIRRMTSRPDLSEINELKRLVSEIDTFESRKESALLVAEVFYKLELFDVAQALSEEYGLDSFDIESERLPASLEEEK